MKIKLNYSESPNKNNEFLLGMKSIVKAMNLDLEKEISWCCDQEIILERNRYVTDTRNADIDWSMAEKYALGWVMTLQYRYEHIAKEEIMNLYHKIYENLYYPC